MAESTGAKPASGSPHTACSSDLTAAASGVASDEGLEIEEELGLSISDVRPITGNGTVARLNNVVGPFADDLFADGMEDS